MKNLSSCICNTTVRNLMFFFIYCCFRCFHQLFNIHLYAFIRVYADELPQSHKHLCMQTTAFNTFGETKIYKKLKVPTHCINTCKNLIFEIIGAILCLIVAYDRNKMFAPPSLILKQDVYYLIRILVTFEYCAIHKQ